MALLCHKQMTKVDKTRISVHEAVRGTYSIFRDSSGRRYFQIDTYGSEDRKTPDKISQSLQFDEETAFFLIQLIKNELNLN